MREYVLRGVPDCLRRDGWWLMDETSPAEPALRDDTRGLPRRASGASTGREPPETRS